MKGVIMAGGLGIQLRNKTEYRHKPMEFNKEFFSYLYDSDGCVLEKEPVEKLSAANELMVYPHEGY
jgi:NDP-sugar pyrophosphorylase family protein